MLIAGSLIAPYEEILQTYPDLTFKQYPNRVFAPICNLFASELYKTVDMAIFLCYTFKKI